MSSAVHPWVQFQGTMTHGGSVREGEPKGVQVPRGGPQPEKHLSEPRGSGSRPWGSLVPHTFTPPRGHFVLASGRCTPTVRLETETSFHGDDTRAPGDSLGPWFGPCSTSKPR